MLSSHTAGAWNWGKGHVIHKLGRWSGCCLQSSDPPHPYPWSSSFFSDFLSHKWARFSDTNRCFLLLSGNFVDSLYQKGKRPGIGLAWFSVVWKTLIWHFILGQGGHLKWYTLNKHFSPWNFVNPFNSVSITASLSSVYHAASQLTQEQHTCISEIFNLLLTFLLIFWALATCHLLTAIL